MCVSLQGPWTGWEATATSNVTSAVAERKKATKKSGQCLAWLDMRPVVVNSCFALLSWHNGLRGGFPAVVNIGSVHVTTCAGGPGVCRGGWTWGSGCILHACYTAAKRIVCFAFGYPML